MALCFVLLLSLVCRNYGVAYYGSRRIYPQSSTSALCNDYLEVSFDFDDTSTAVVIHIMASTNTAWFSVGFPSIHLYYDKSKRKSDLMNGYALTYIDGDIYEHTIAATNNMIHTMTPRNPQNIIVNSIDNSGGAISITLTRNLFTSDPNDFQFTLGWYLDCYPFLMTVAIGDGLTLGAGNSFGSSYVYLYDKSLLSDTTEFNQMWNVTLAPNSPNYPDVPVSVSLTMNPTTKIVSVQIDDGPTGTGPERAWGLSFPDLADIAYYHPEDTNPIGMESDYAIFWGNSTALNSDGKTCGFQNNWNKNTAYTEARIPVNGAECGALLGAHTECWDALPNPQIHNTLYSETDSIDHYTFDLQFQSCGYEFNPYEFQTCRPLTMVAAAVMPSRGCLSDFETVTDGVHHNIDKIQINAFPTRHPTPAPSASPSPPPTRSPSNAPSTAPTRAPVHPTVSPTVGTAVPTSVPSISPIPITGAPSSMTATPTMSPSSMTATPTTSPLSNAPSTPPTKATVHPTVSPTDETAVPTSVPSTSPIPTTAVPSSSPSNDPTTPTGSPSSIPSSNPSITPSNSPLVVPTTSPSNDPTSSPSSDPTSVTVSPSIPTSNPSADPNTLTKSPTIPTVSPSSIPTNSPLDVPTESPTKNPSTNPSDNPTMSPSNNPTKTPSNHPTITPVVITTANPSKYPTVAPSSDPTKTLTTQPPTQNPLGDGQTAAPTRSPTRSPTTQPTTKGPTVTGETLAPTSLPTVSPSRSPTVLPTSFPTKTGETRSPTVSPSAPPSTAPTAWRDCIDKTIPLSTGEMQIFIMISEASREMEIQLSAPKAVWFGVGFGADRMNRTLAITVSSIEGVMAVRPRRLQHHVSGDIVSNALDGIGTAEYASNRAVSIPKLWTMDGLFDFSDFLSGNQCDLRIIWAVGLDQNLGNHGPNNRGSVTLRSCMCSEDPTTSPTKLPTASPTVDPTYKPTSAPTEDIVTGDSPSRLQLSFGAMLLVVCCIFFSF